MSDHPHDRGSGLDFAASGGADAVIAQEARVAFAARLGDVESLPLASRAEAFGEIHDELRAVIEGTTGDAGQGGR